MQIRSIIFENPIPLTSNLYLKPVALTLITDSNWKYFHLQIAAVRMQQEMAEWGAFRDAQSPIHSPSHSQVASSSGDTPAKTKSKSRDDRDVYSTETKVQSLSNERNDRRYMGESSSGGTRRHFNSFNYTGDYSTWDYRKYLDGSEPGDDGYSGGNNAQRNTESGSASRTVNGSVGAGNEATMQKVTMN